MGREYLPSGRKWCALVALAALLFTLAPRLVAAQNPTTFTATAQAIADGHRINLDGRLLSGDVAVDRVEVHVSIGAVSIGATRTNNHGAFRLNFSVPEAQRSGTQSVELRFDGSAQFAPVSSVLPVVMNHDSPTNPATAAAPSATDPVEPVTEEPVAPPADVRPATSLSLAVAPQDPRPGDLLTLTGTLTVAGTGVPSGRIQVSLGNRDSADSLTYSDDSGRFTTYLEVPAEHPAGRVQVRVRFAESDAHLGSDGATAITVREPLPTASPEPTTPPSAAPRKTADVQNQTIRTATTVATSTSPVPDVDTAIGDEGDEGDEGTLATVAGPASTFLVALVAVGGSSLLVAVALLMRRSGRGEGDGDAIPAFFSDAGSLWGDELDVHVDAADDAHRPVRTGDDPEATQLDMDLIRPEDPPTPRRALPDD